MPAFGALGTNAPIRNQGIIDGELRSALLAINPHQANVQGLRLPSQRASRPFYLQCPRRRERRKSHSKGTGGSNAACAHPLQLSELAATGATKLVPGVGVGGPSTTPVPAAHR